MDLQNSKAPGVRVLVVVAVVVVFAALTATLTWQLRSRLRTEVLRREAEAIHAVALMQLEPAEARLAEFGAEFVIDDMFAAVLESSRLRGVLAVQLFDAAGKLRQAKPLAPDDVESSTWWPPTLEQAQARFIAAGSLDQVSPIFALQDRTGGQVPLVDIVVPLRSRNGPGVAHGIARYWIDGAAVAAEFERTERSLFAQAGVVFLGGALLAGGILTWAFSRLSRAHRQLQAQSEDLARANQELDFAAKTGALGAISAHLIHGLKNPLAGIEGFVFETVIGSADTQQGEACRTAIETTRRLRSLVAEVTAVMKDEQDGGADYPVLVAEVIEAARVRGLPAAEAAGVMLSAVADPRLFIRARVANLSGLVLANLVTNAIEACSPGGTVSLSGNSSSNGIEFIVRDTGPGLPEDVRRDLFRPVRSAKRGGGGMGLAISLRLAKHAGGSLELVRSGPEGTEFRLTVPSASKA